jgi:hypothetical protein
MRSAMSMRHILVGSCVLAVGLCGCSKPNPSAGAPSRIKLVFGVTLPPSAANALFDSQSLMSLWAYARFDVDPNDVPTVQSAGILTKLPALSQRREVVEKMRTIASQWAWAQPPLDANAVASETTWKELRSTHRYDCRLWMCVIAGRPRSTVYLVYSEENIDPLNTP